VVLAVVLAALVAGVMAAIMVLVAMLEQAGAEPGPCLDPADAIAAVAEDPDVWDLVITDYDMPGLNGAALAKRLRGLRADLPLMLLSALPRAHLRRAGEAELFDAVLGKPANLDALVSAARTAMAAARKRST
jgi:CheY-like chemotaxis protein